MHFLLIEKKNGTNLETAEKYRYKEYEIYACYDVLNIADSHHFLAFSHYVPS